MGIETLGLAFSIAGAAVAVFLSGIGSSIGLAAASRAATGVLSENRNVTAP